MLSGWLAFGPPPVLALEDYGELLSMLVRLERIIPINHWVQTEVSVEEMFGG